MAALPPPPSLINNILVFGYVYIASFLIIHYSQISMNFDKYKRQIGDGQVVLL